MTNQELLPILSNVRTFLEKKSCPFKTWNESLSGACAVGSFIIWEILKREGHKPRLVMSTEGCEAHCWVKLGKKVLDVTATQFGDYPKLLIMPAQKYANLPFVYGKKYYNEDVIEDLIVNWPREQTPWHYAKAIRRSFKIKIEDATL